MKLIALIIVIISLIIYNWICFNTFLNGNWMATTDFLVESGIDEMLLNIKGFVKKSVRILFFKNGENEVLDDNFFMYFTSPLCYFLLSPTKGFFYSSLEIFDKGKINFEFDPFVGKLVFSGKKKYGEFIKVKL